jgi:hypothetical protein
MRGNSVPLNIHSEQYVKLIPVDYTKPSTKINGVRQKQTLIKLAILEMRAFNRHLMTSRPVADPGFLFGRGTGRGSRGRKSPSGVQGRSPGGGLGRSPQKLKWNVKFENLGSYASLRRT